MLAIDRDPLAIRVLSERFAAAIAAGQLSLHAVPFSELGELVAKLGLAGQVQGIAADLGVSSPQLDTAERGFSFQHDGPLDMRMSPESPLTAADVLAQYTEKELADLFFQLGEEPKARTIARAIVRGRGERAIVTTHALAELVKRSLPYAKTSRKHPATKVFQALRIHVNDELGEVRRMLEAGFAALRPGGRLGVISFHSLEDRIVKRFCQGKAGKLYDPQIPRELAMLVAASRPSSELAAAIIKPFPGLPSASECQANPRSRSAKLRVLAKQPQPL